MPFAKMTLRTSSICHDCCYISLGMAKGKAMASQEGKRSKATCGHSFHRDCLQEQLPQDLTNSGGTCKSIWGAMKVFGTSSSTT